MDREPLNSVFPSRSNSVDETNHDEQIHVEGHPLSPRHPHSVGGHEPDSDSDTQSPHSLSDHDSESDSDTHSNDGRGPPPSYLHSQANNFADGSELEELYLLVEHQYQQYVLSVSRLQTLMQRIRVTLTLMVFVLTIGIFTVCAIALLIIQRLITIRNIKIAPDLDTSSRIIQLGAAPGERVLVPIVTAILVLTLYDITRFVGSAVVVHGLPNTDTYRILIGAYAFVRGAIVLVIRSAVAVGFRDRDSHPQDMQPSRLEDE